MDHGGKRPNDEVETGNYRAKTPLHKDDTPAENTGRGMPGGATQGDSPGFGMQEAGFQKIHLNENPGESVLEAALATLRR